LLQTIAFGVVQLLYHGIALPLLGLIVRPLSGESLGIPHVRVAMLYASLRFRTGSLFPAMASHAASTLTMIPYIFAALWTEIVG
jgi:uncharacterized protein